MEQPPEFETLDDAERFALSSHPLRREAIRWLAEHDGSIALDDLATSLATDDSLSAVTDPIRTRVELHHIHLPKLQEYGLVTYDHENLTIIPE